MFGRWLNVPEPTLIEIHSQFRTDAEKKAAFLRVYATEHPEPTWEHVSDALYRIKNEQYHKTLDILQSVFPTGEFSPSFLDPPLGF